VTKEIISDHSKHVILSKSAPIAPICEQYLPWEVLADETKMKAARNSIRERLEESLSKLFFGHWELGGNTPDDLARRLVEGYDDVTVSLVDQGIRHGWIDDSEIEIFRRFNATSENARAIVLLVIALHEAIPDEAAIPLPLIWGLQRHGEFGFEFDLSSDYLFKKSLATLLYGFAVRRLWSHELFQESELDYSKVLRDDIVALLSRRPDDALRIASIVIDRGEHDNALIEEILDSASVPLSEGAL